MQSNVAFTLVNGTVIETPVVSIVELNKDCMITKFSRYVSLFPLIAAAAELGASP